MRRAFSAAIGAQAVREQARANLHAPDLLKVRVRADRRELKNLVEGRAGPGRLRVPNNEARRAKPSTGAAWLERAALATAPRPPGSDLNSVDGEQPT